MNKTNWKALFLYMTYWRQFPLLTAMSFGFSCIVAANLTVIPLLASLLLRQLLQHQTLNASLLLCTVILQGVFVTSAYLLDKYGIAVLHHRVEHLLYENAFRYLVRQDYSFFANRFSGSLVTQASRFAKQYTTFNDVVFFDLTPQLLSVLIAISLLMYYSWPVGLLVTLVWLGSVTLTIKFGLGRMAMRRAAVAKESEQVGELADMLTNATTVKTYGAEDRELSRYNKVNVLRGEYFLRSWWRAVRNGWIVEGIASLLFTIVLVGGLLAIHRHTIDVAAFLLFQVYALRIIDNIRRNSMIVRQLEVVAGDAQEMTEMLDQPPQIVDAPQPEPIHIKQGEITFEDVSFRYEDASNAQTNLFENFSLAIAAGERIGLVGPSGGGKTTITRLLLRFMDIQDGTIAIDGQDIRQVAQQELHQAIGYVPQEPLLFHRSLLENIGYGKPGASKEEIIAVSKRAHADDFIRELPEGYDTLVGERGVKLSGGQRQRVAIARAMLKNAPILVLDEATSALDSESEKYIQEALWELMEGKTTLVIAHRLSTIQHLDRIVVIDKGQIIEQGSHAELLKQKGLYAKLWKHQSGGFLEQ